MAIKITGFLVKGFFLLNLLVLASLTTTLDKMDKKDSLGPVPEFLSWGKDNEKQNTQEVKDTTAVSSQEQKTENEDPKQDKQEKKVLGGNNQEETIKKGASPSSSPIPTTGAGLSPSPTQVPNPTVQPTSSSNQCIASGGTSATFPNSCGDSCILVQYPGEINCLDVMTDSCDCGPNMCWDGTGCMDNPKVISNPKPTDPPKPVCGNNICEPGETSYADCVECPVGQEYCPLIPCSVQIGACAQDCRL